MAFYNLWNQHKVLAILFLIYIFFSPSAFAAGPTPPDEATILNLILEDYPHRLVKQSGVASAVWNPDQTFRTDFLTPEGEYTTEIINSKVVQIRGSIRMLLISSTNSEYNHVYASAPAIGCSELEFDGKNWQLKSNELKVDMMGSSGWPPEMKLIKIGPDRWGMASDLEYSRQGAFGGRFILYQATGCRQGLIFDVETLSGVNPMMAGMFSEYTDIEAKVTFLPCKSCEYYNIQVVTQSTDFKANDRQDKYIQVGPKRVETVRYSFQGDRYLPVK